MSKFNPDWLNESLHPQFKDWLSADPKNPGKAHCKVCRKSFSLSNMGIRSLKSHAEGTWHVKSLSSVQGSASLRSFVVCQPSSNVSEDALSLGSGAAAVASPAISVQSAGASVSTPSDSGDASSASLRSSSRDASLGFLPDSDVKRAELMWTLRTVAKKQSFRAQEGISDYFAKMFPDSQIAKRMQLSRTKTSYLVTHALAPFFHEILKDEVKFARGIVICFDESFNKISKRGQMDVAIRLWDNKKNEISTRYWNSAFLGHATADDLLSAFKGALADVDLHHIVQLSMDGPNVNWSFVQKLKADLKTCEEDPEILDVGSCGLHVVHGAFKRGFEQSGWDIAPFLRSAYNVFKESPARRADFMHVSKCEEFPVKFCNVRWLENTPAAERAIKILPQLKKYVSSSSLPKTYTVKKLSEGLDDPLILAKLQFFRTIACSLEPFLREFQTSKPMFPFIHGAVENLVRELMARFVKHEVLVAATSAYKLVNVNLDEVSQGLKLAQIDIGIGTKEALRAARIKDVDVDRFRLDCKKILTAIVKKIIERSPIKYKMARAASCLDPKKILKDKALCKSNMDTCIAVLLEHRRVSTLEADQASLQFRKFLNEVDLESLKEFKRSTHRLDTLYAKLLGGDLTHSKTFGKL